MSIPKGVADYIGVEEGMLLNDASHERVSANLRKAIVDDATLSSCPAANDFPEGLWNVFCLALILTPTVSPGSAQRNAKAARLHEEIALQRKRQKSRESSQKNRDKLKAAKLARQREEREAAARMRTEVGRLQRELKKAEEEAAANAKAATQAAAKQGKAEEEAAAKNQQLDEEQAATERLEGEKAKEAGDKEELKRRLANAKRAATRARNEAGRQKRVAEGLAKRGGGTGEQHGKRKRLPRRCNEQAAQEPHPRKTVLQCRPDTSFSFEKVRIGKSDVHGHGLISNVDTSKGDLLFELVAPEWTRDLGYEAKDYNCYRHIAHRDNQSVLLIDAAGMMEATLEACLEDAKMSHLRAINHAQRDFNAEFVFGGAVRPDWYFPMGGVEFKWWYTCQVRTLGAIRKDEEVKIEYAWAPKKWK